MKTSKLLFLFPLLGVAPIATISSCGEQPMDAEWVADAIFGPIEKNPQTISGDSSFIKELEKLEYKDRISELLYSLYYFTNQKDALVIELPDSLSDLYKNQTVGIKSIINEQASSIKITQNTNGTYSVNCSFVGYVSFIFLKDYESMFKANDYIMITYDFKGYEINVDVSNEKCGIKYGGYPICVGFIKARSNGGELEKLIPIWTVSTPEQPFTSQFIDITDTDIPHNGHNWVKS